MDSLTHIALGACIGDVFAGKQLGKRAMFLGAVAQSVPDIDFLAAFWSSESENLLEHRGFTHSILFVLLISPPLAMLAERWRKPHDISLKKWVLFFAIQAFIHLLLDGLNAYGVGWFEPFSNIRVSLNWIYVADPFFSVWLGIAFTMLLVLRRNHPKRKWWIKFGVGISMIYLLYCGLNKWKIDRDVKNIFHKQEIAYNTYFTTPTPFNSWLWFVVASNDSGYYIGYRSVFDSQKEMDLRFLPRNDTALTPYLDSTGKEDLRNLVRFSKGYYAIEYWGDTLVFNDLRFGQIIGWGDLNARFAFYYFLQYPGDNLLLVQRGRFKGWNREALRTLLRRIRGN